MPGPVSRRNFLRSAGGITFLALAPAGRGLFAVLADGSDASRVPRFTALPYVQPGPDGALVAGREAMRLVWQTEPKAAPFSVRFGTGKLHDRPADVVRSERPFRDATRRFNYWATLEPLELGTRYSYEVRSGPTRIAEGYFTTRQPRGRPIRFAAFGDNSHGSASDRAIAYQTYRAWPDFVMNTGDNVYEAGLDSEYGRYFFPVYNADAAGPDTGAPLLRSVPFYTVLANHDVIATDRSGRPAADLGRDPDALAYFTNFHLPLNGPVPARPTPVVASPEGLRAFRSCAGSRFPSMANYSHDQGDAHFLCLDSNLYVDPSDPGLRDWIERDLTATDALWKFAVYHHSAFNAGREHYTEQHMRVLAPLFERCGVDFVLNGHEHNYQRTRPIRFRPGGIGGAARLNSKHRLVPGTFEVDRSFDGLKHTRPDGIIHLTTGAGGKQLYDTGYSEHPGLWLHAKDRNADYVARFISDRHSLSVFDIDGPRLLLRQIDQSGREVDRIRVTKA